jgi:hypothetical protein
MSNVSGVVPSFNKSSSTELDDLLNTIRNQIIMPGYLSPAQQELVYKPKHRKMLINDEVTANIAGEKFRLEYIDVEHVRPSPRKALLNALDKFQEKDMDMLPGLLEGIHKSHPKVTARPAVARRVASRAAKFNREDVLLECVRQAEATGLRLGNEDCAINVMGSFLAKAKTEGNAEALKKATKWSEMVLDLLEDPKHVSEYPGLPDPRTIPEVVAPHVELTAMKAKQTGDANDIGQVEQYGKRLLALSPNATQPTKEDYGFLNIWLNDYALVLYTAAKSAGEVLGSGSETGAGLTKWASKLKDQMTPVYNSMKDTDWAQEKTRTGLQKYKEIFGDES